eukprot:scaffold5744_cov115-Pinguiococcus_pyrenoidosus.AAC.1
MSAAANGSAGLRVHGFLAGRPQGSRGRKPGFPPSTFRPCSRCPWNLWEWDLRGGCGRLVR